MTTRQQYPREEGTYRNMMSRCYNPNATGYEYYGGRGITVCDRWKESFENFLEDMGPRPDNMTLDRIEVNGNYEKSNCRWATNEEQGNNRTNNTVIEYLGEKKTIEQWSEILNIKANTITYRLLREWSVAECLEKIERSRPVYSGKLTAEEIEEAIRLRKQGLTNIEIGELFNIDNSCISRLMTKKGVIPNVNKKDIKHQEIYNLHLDGLSYEKIKEKTGIPISTISFAVKKMKSKEDIAGIKADKLSKKDL
jgi:hypothetical protein